MTINLDPFRQAEAQFRWLTQQRATGLMDEATFRNALAALRLQDAQGRWWVPQEGTGAWLLWNGSQWLPASPYPPVAPAAPPPPPAPAPAPYAAPQWQRGSAPLPHAGAPTPVGDPNAAPKSLLGQSLKYLFITLVIFGIIGVVVIVASKGQAPPLQVLAGVGLAALISWIFTMRSLSQAWEGQVVELRVEQKKRVDADGDVDYEDVLYAFIRQPDGRTRKERAMGDWPVGTYLRKARGDNFVRKLN